jgi:hypothetical protein
LPALLGCKEDIADDLGRLWQQCVCKQREQRVLFLSCQQCAKLDLAQRRDGSVNSPSSCALQHGLCFHRFSSKPHGTHILLLPFLRAGTRSDSRRG